MLICSAAAVRAVVAAVAAAAATSVTQGAAVAPIHKSETSKDNTLL